MDEKDWMFFFFEKTFLLADITMNIVFGMLFIILSNVKVNFNDWELRWELYITAEALPNTKQVEMVGNKTFTAIAVD